MAVLNDATAGALNLGSANTADYDQYPDAQDRNISFGLTNDYTVVSTKPISKPIPGGYALIPVGPVGGVRG